jgi:hypothetical protein
MLFTCQNHKKCAGSINTETDTIDYLTGKTLPEGQFKCTYCGMIQSIDLDPEVAIEEQKRANTKTVYRRCPNGSGKVHEIRVPVDHSRPSNQDRLSDIRNCSCEFRYPLEEVTRTIEVWEEDEKGDKRKVRKDITETVQNVDLHGGKHSVHELLKSGEEVSATGGRRVGAGMGVR